MTTDLETFFSHPLSAKHRQYEALRCHALEGLTAKEAGQRFGLSEATIHTLAHELRVGKLQFFPPTSTGPKDRRAPHYLRDLVCELRQQELSASDIVQKLHDQDLKISLSTVERILKDAGFGRLKRRTRGQRGLSVLQTALPQRAQDLEQETLKPFRAECQVAGVFFFIPYLIESGVLDVFEKLPLPESERIGKVQAGLSFLLLKLIGGERLSHVRQYDHDRGFGLFAGLNVLPKPSYMGSYSCRLSDRLCRTLQEEMVSMFNRREPEMYNGATINLDFHSIPHFGEQSEMEKVWAGARNKAMKGANTFFAQDAESNVMLYANSDVLRRDGSDELLYFTEYWKSIKGVIQETLVFDSRLTTYKTLDILDQSQIKFITLRIRNKTLKKYTDSLSDDQWQKVTLPIPKRKHQKFLVHENETTLTGCSRPFRQLILKDHGRAEPTYVISNDRSIKITDLLTVYARRWRIENKLAELVKFFNINSLSSPIMIRIHFDLLLSVMACFLYQRMAQDLPRFENHLAPDLFRRFIDMPGMVRFDGACFKVQIRKRAHTPILMGMDKLLKPVEVPWLGGRKMEIEWKA